MSRDVTNIIGRLFPASVGDFVVLSNVIVSIATDIEMDQNVLNEPVNDYSESLNGNELKLGCVDVCENGYDLEVNWRTIGRSRQFQEKSIIALRFLGLVGSEASVEGVISTQRRLLLLGMSNMKDDLLEARPRNSIKRVTRNMCLIRVYDTRK